MIFFAIIRRCNIPEIMSYTLFCLFWNTNIFISKVKKNKFSSVFFSNFAPKKPTWGCYYSGIKGLKSNSGWKKSTSLNQVWIRNESFELQSRRSEFEFHWGTLLFQFLTRLFFVKNSPLSLLVYSLTKLMSYF